jgi:hypothetical protein
LEEIGVSKGHALKMVVNLGKMIKGRDRHQREEDGVGRKNRNN